jgi:hypothetical protein
MDVWVKRLAIERAVFLWVPTHVHNDGFRVREQTEHLINLIVGQPFQVHIPYLRVDQPKDIPCSRRSETTALYVQSSDLCLFLCFSRFR